MNSTRVGMELDLTSFNFHHWDLDIETCSAAGFRFATLASLGDNFANRQALFAFVSRTRGQAIYRLTAEAQYWGFARDTFDIPSYDPRGVSIVLRGSEWVAISQISDVRESGDMFDEGTWVEPIYRRRGLAIALKAMSMKFVQERGIDSVRTYVNPGDEASLGLYRVLGFH